MGILVILCTRFAVEYCTADQKDKCGLTLPLHSFFLVLWTYAAGSSAVGLYRMTDARRDAGEGYVSLSYLVQYNIFSSMRPKADLEAIVRLYNTKNTSVGWIFSGDSGRVSACGAILGKDVHASRIRLWGGLASASSASLVRYDWADTGLCNTRTSWAMYHSTFP